MKIVAVITARQNSNRITNKNLKKIGNKTLVERTMRISMSINSIQDVIITTDSKKITNLAKYYGLKCILERPKNLSRNYSRSADVVIHAISWYQKNFSEVDAIILLQPTTPFRKLSFIEKCIELFKKKNKPIISVYPKNHTKSNLSDGSVYIISKKNLFLKKSFMENIATRISSTSKKESLDLDSISDLHLANKYAILDEKI
jgi:CMP-N-acetylneuraminic acid synthetase